ncbi:hypothetical protein GCM10010994_14100 [Chelatococcus reniformis]|uniref:Uncharacterized protein n=1 Tax=Chelatococcus reniformis TaxID=1494448 RepID=A0A916U123_9HYPH|nr:hypothetical protein GCM10010994_14100 [Chelatococcus reniformis]
MDVGQGRQPGPKILRQFLSCPAPAPGQLKKRHYAGEYVFHAVIEFKPEFRLPLEMVANLALPVPSQEDRLDAADEFQGGDGPLIE